MYTFYLVTLVHLILSPYADDFISIVWCVSFCYDVVLDENSQYYLNSYHNDTLTDDAPNDWSGSRNSSLASIASTCGNALMSTKRSKPIIDCVSNAFDIDILGLRFERTNNKPMILNDHVHVRDHKEEPAPNRRTEKLKRITSVTRWDSHCIASRMK